MNCLAEERFIELLDAGGLEATKPEERAHLEACEACRDSWGAVAAAGEVLADARPRASGRATRWVPLAAAAAMLLAVLGIIVATKTPSPVQKPMKDPVTLFIEGTPDEMKGASEALLKAGRKALPGMVAARPKLKGSPRERLFLDLMWAIKVAAVKQDPARLAICQKLESMKIDLAFVNTNLDDVLSFLRDFSSLNIVLDPSLGENAPIDVNCKNMSLRSVLEVIAAVRDLDFDVKYGVVFLGKPMRLWSTDPAVGLPEANGWRKQALDGTSAGVGGKLDTIRITIDMSNAPMSAIRGYLVEISGLPFVLRSIPDEPVTLKFQNLSLAHALELLTLPHGRDVRIEKGNVEIFDPGK